MIYPVFLGDHYLLLLHVTNSPNEPQQIKHFRRITQAVYVYLTGKTQQVVFFYVIRHSKHNIVKKNPDNKCY